MNNYKLSILLSMLSLCNGTTFAQTTSQNYVKTQTMLDANGSTSIPAVQYYNGLGYPTVSVTKTGDGGQTSYSLVTYDGVGREQKKYLPLSTDSYITYKAPSTIISNSSSSTGYSDAAAYSLTKYDALDRPVSVTTPGSVFTGRPSNIMYQANGKGEVKRFIVSGNSLSQNSVYAANTLYKEVATDPDGKKTETFKDLTGKVIMQRVGGSLCTYYVYDELDQLRFVLPPKYQSDGDQSATCYEYRYDSRGRMNYKKLPGCGYVEYWYDNADRLICMQDAEMRIANKYRFFIYDKFNHLVVQGLSTSCYCDSTTIQNAIFSEKDYGVLGTGYVVPIVFAGAQLEVANYYDGNQSRISNDSDKNAYFSSIAVSPSVAQTGQLTGTISAASNGEYLAQTLAYDIKGNVINTKSRDLGGMTTANTSSYTFTNNVSSSTSTVNVKYGNCMTVVESYGYNSNNNQMSSHSLTLNHGTAASASLSYVHNKLGQLFLVTRPLTSGVCTVSYAYTLNGWVKSITTNSFAEELFYNDGNGTPCYNGNISSIRWKDNLSSTKKGYKYSYDSANRMLSGVYGEGDNLSSNTNRYNESMSYDANGNITRITRYGKTSSSSYGLMDNLTISYSGNQPTSVTESATDYNVTGSFDYKKAKGSGYMFNSNGSLIADKSRGIAYITYDYNNNPKQIYFTNGNITKYVYSASGQKLRVVHYTAVTNITRTWGSKPAELTNAQIQYKDSTDYLLGGNLLVKNGKVDKYLFGDGYAQASVASSTTDKFAFYYYNKDHLGNNREVVDANGTVQQVTNYYPYGATFADADGVENADLQQFKYGGKELDRMHGLDTYDNGARQHDPVLARWDRVDPLCEKYYSMSPYAYCNANPVMFVDPDGKCPLIPIIVLALKGAAIEAATEYGCQVLENWHNSKEGFTMKCLKPNSWSKIGTSAVEGGLTAGAGITKKLMVGIGTCLVQSVIDNYEEGYDAVIIGSGINGMDKLLSELGCEVTGKIAGNMTEKIMKYFRSSDADAPIRSLINRLLEENPNLDTKTASEMAHIIKENAKKRPEEWSEKMTEFTEKLYELLNPIEIKNDK